jgi:hypothetical protein
MRIVDAIDYIPISSSNVQGDIEKRHAKPHCLDSRSQTRPLFEIELIAIN